MSEKKKINLDKPMSWEGQTYGPGVVEMPEKAADYAERRKFGKIERSSSGGDDFKPLSPKETFERFEKGDGSDEVFASLKHWQPVKVEGAKTGKTLADFQQEFEANQAKDSASAKENSVGGKSEENPEDKSKGQTTDPTGLPKDFPNRAAFARLGFTSVEQVHAKSRDELIAMNGIAEKSADEALAYGKGE